MRPEFCKLVFRLQCLMNREDGQSLIEYALLVSMLSLAAIAAMTNVATGIAKVFDQMSSTLAGIL
jgi:Flp pilus assembly pilin Flp